MRLRIAAIAVVLLAGCTTVDASRSWNGTGTVAGHAYDDPDDWDTESSTCWSYDKYSNCTFRTYETTHHHDPAHWYLDIDDVFWGGEHRVEVGQVMYDRCRDGAEYTTSGCRA